MQHLADIVRIAAASPALMFRREAYRRDSVREFLRDVMALANAPVEGTRYIFTGCADAPGQREIPGIEPVAADLAIDWRGLVGEFIEPPIRLRYETVDVDGKRVGAFEVGDCQDRPYMMRVDHSETLRRGDAYMRVNDVAVKLGRRQLQALFEKKFREAVSAATVEVGFSGDIVHKELTLPIADLDELPSRVASARLLELAAARRGGHGATSRLVRLTHARLFGTEHPYVDRSVDELNEEVRAIGEQYRDADDRHLYTEAAEAVQLVVVNQGDEPLLDTSIKLSLPYHEAMHVVARPPRTPPDGTLGFMDDEASADYPAVSQDERAVHVAATMGDIAPGAMTEVFRVPLMLCAEAALDGRRVALDYVLFARNLREPVRGRLRVRFAAAARDHSLTA